MRSLFVTGALAVIRYAKIHGTKHLHFPREDRLSKHKRDRAGAVFSASED